MASSPTGAGLVRSRYTPLPQHRLRLQPRDVEFLVQLYLRVVLTRDQILRLGVWPSLPRANHRLRKLFDHGFVTRLWPLVGRHGSQGIYCIGKAATPYIARELDVLTSEITANFQCGAMPTTLEHLLSITDLEIEFRRSASAQERKLELWLPERACRHEFEVREQSGIWTPHVLKPDAYVQLGGLAAFVECDLGHVGSAKFARKLACYALYAELGLCREAYDRDAVAVLTITTGPKRREHLREIAYEAGLRSAAFTTFAEVQARGPMSPIWHGIDRSDPPKHAEAFCDLV